VDAAAEADHQVAAARGVTAESCLYLVLRIGDGIAAGGDEDVAAIDLASVSGGDRHELQHRGDHRTNR
jgi:hypothetical protein